MNTKMEIDDLLEDKKSDNKEQENIFDILVDLENKENIKEDDYLNFKFIQTCQ